jgi:hypothetical protein
MDAGIAALLGALIGGIASLVGGFGVARFQAKREESRQEKDRLRDNLYALQEAIDPTFREYLAEIEGRWVDHLQRFVLHGPSYPNPDLASAVYRINMLSLRVGDDPLANLLSPLLQELAQARNAPSQEEAIRHYNAARELISPALHRMGELLHTDANVDLGISSTSLSKRSE